MTEVSLSLPIALRKTLEHSEPSTRPLESFSDRGPARLPIRERAISPARCTLPARNCFLHAMTLLLVKVPGVAKADAHIAARRPEYAEPMRRTSAFVPRSSRELSRVVARDATCRPLRRDGTGVEFPN